MAVNERVSEGPVQHRVPGQVQDAVSHLVDPFGPAGRREHGQADMLRAGVDQKTNQGRDENAEIYSTNTQVSTEF